MSSYGHRSHASHSYTNWLKSLPALLAVVCLLLQGPLMHTLSNTTSLPTATLAAVQGGNSSVPTESSESSESQPFLNRNISAIGGFTAILLMLMPMRYLIPAVAKVRSTPLVIASVVVLSIVAIGGWLIYKNFQPRDERRISDKVGWTFFIGSGVGLLLVLGAMFLMYDGATRNNRR